MVLSSVCLCDLMRAPQFSRLYAGLRSLAQNDLPVDHRQPMLGCFIPPV